MVYFVRAGEYVKIGVADNIFSRMSALQTGCPMQLECLLLLQGGYDLEMELHDRFRALHQRGEWFVWGDDVAAYVTDARESGNDLSGVLRSGLEDSTDTDDFGAFVRELRRTAGLSVQDVASRLGISKTAALAVETGSNPTLDVMRRHLRLFGAGFHIR